METNTVPTITEEVLSAEDVAAIDAAIGTSTATSFEPEVKSETQERIISLLDARIATALATGNEGLASKFQNEKSVLSRAAYATVFDAHGIDVQFMEKIAIYALQKVRKIVAAFNGAGRLDIYTKTLLDNAKVLASKNVPFSYGLQQAALSKAVTHDKSAKLKKRLASVPSTAGTQASSTRMALYAMGLAKSEKAESDRVTVFDFEHPIMQKVAS